MHMARACAIILVITILTGLLSACIGDTEPKNVLRIYLKHWQEEQYPAMYKLLSTESKKRISEEEFIHLHKKIAATIGQERIWFTVSTDHEQAGALSFQTTIISRFIGKITLNNQSRLIEEEAGWRVVWSPSLIFPDMEVGDQVTTIQTGVGRRGEIKDRHGKPLAINQKANIVGIIPDEVEDHSQLLRKLSNLLEIPLQDIEARYEEAETKTDYFIPLAIVPASERKVINQVRSLPGVTIRQTFQRVYPQKEKTAHLIGYVQPIPAGQMNKWESHQYLPGEWIGWAGLEKELEEQLHSRDGWKISILDGKGREKKVIGEQDPIDGKEVRLTIDLEAQKRWYQTIAKKKGAAVALHPKTGEILAAVSSPSYDPNQLITGLSSKEKEHLNRLDRPLVSRFQSLYMPGGTIYPFTAAVGLDSGHLTQKTTFDTSEGKWQKNDSWGNHFIMNDIPQEKASLKTSFALSDSIYFAKASTKIGAKKLQDSFLKFGFKQNLPIPLPIKPSQISKQEKIENEIQLVETGIGKGELRVTPLFMATAYTCFVNDGDILQPQLLLAEKSTNKPMIWQSQVISSQTAQTVHHLLTEAVQLPESPLNQLNLQEVTLGAISTGEKENNRYESLVLIAGKKKPDLIAVLFIDQKGDKEQSSLFSKVKKALEATYH